jgi:hypothetical protein
MGKKLTLSIDEAVITEAKRYADRQGISLSNLVENLLKHTTGIVAKRRDRKVSTTPLADGLVGILKNTAAEKSDYWEHQAKKHGVK